MFVRVLRFFVRDLLLPTEGVIQQDRADHQAGDQGAEDQVHEHEWWPHDPQPTVVAKCNLLGVVVHVSIRVVEERHRRPEHSTLDHELADFGVGHANCDVGHEIKRKHSSSVNVCAFRDGKLWGNNLNTLRTLQG